MFQTEDDGEGFDCVNVEIKNAGFTIHSSTMDANSRLPSFSRFTFCPVILVVDCGDRQSVEKGKDILHGMMQFAELQVKGHTHTHPLSLSRRREEKINHLTRAQTPKPKQGVPVLIYANKSDIPGCMSAREVEQVLCLDELPKHGGVNPLPDREGHRQPYFVQGCAAKAPNGHVHLTRGLEWLANWSQKIVKRDDCCV